MSDFQYPYCPKHEAWVEDGTVRLANEEDGYYMQIFYKREQLDEFICELRKVADEAWPVSDSLVTDNND